MTHTTAYNTFRMGRATTLSGYQRKDEECPTCDDGFLYEHAAEKVCGSCFTVVEPERPWDKKTPWEVFDETRSEYSGWYGEDRVKMVGGFASVYLD